MRINKFIAGITGMGRRTADELIHANRVLVNGAAAQPGQDIADTDEVTLDGKTLVPSKAAAQTIVLNKPPGYVVSRDGQGSRTIYDLLPETYRRLKPVGRLDKYSSGLLLLTSDGQLAFGLTHPSRQKQKVYEVTLGKSLTSQDKARIEQGIQLEDGISKLAISELRSDTAPKSYASARRQRSNTYRITMHEGRNRQIRRTFAALGYTIITLHRTQFGAFRLNGLRPGNYEVVSVTG